MSTDDKNLLAQLRHRQPPIAELRELGPFHAMFAEAAERERLQREGGASMTNGTNDVDGVAERLANAAHYRQRAIDDALRARARMTPEEAAADEIGTELTSYQMLGVIEIHGTTGPRVPSIEILSSPAYREYVQRRAEEIRKEREATPERTTP